MKFLTPQESGLCVQKLGYDARLLPAVSETFSKSAVYALDARGVREPREISRSLADALGDFKVALLWAHTLVWGDRYEDEVPPDDWRDYYRWRQSRGEERRLYDAPGHLFGADEREFLVETTARGIRMGWDAVVAVRPARRVIHLSHDDVVTVQSRTNLTTLTAQLDRLGLRRLR